MICQSQSETVVCISTISVTSIKVCHVAGVVLEKRITARLVSLPLLLMVLHPDDHHWLPVFIVCRLCS